MTANTAIWLDLNMHGHFCAILGCALLLDHGIANELNCAPFHTKMLPNQMVRKVQIIQGTHGKDVSASFVA
jgi:hypothetical protein